MSDKLDALKFISTTHRKLHNERRKYEWKVVVTTLTFFVLTALARSKGDFQAPPPGVVWFVALLLVFVVGLFLVQKCFAAPPRYMRNPPG